MLNAIRHHGPRRGPGRAGLPLGARVLNAIRHHGPRRQTIKTDILRPGKCSTPSGITARGELILRAPLNRLRECSTPSGITARDGLHLRAAVRVALQCSTPSGITACDGDAAHDLEYGREVLNAFWHHGLRRAPNDPTVVRDYECATPSGITAAVDIQRLAYRRVLKCTTPSGITARDGGNVLEIKQHGPRCSTPSGITARDDCSMPRRTRSSWPGAQRLPASRPATDTQLPCVGGTYGWCSTPSGIPARDGSLVAAHGRPGVLHVLNALRHPGPRRHHRAVQADPRWRPVLNAFRHPGPRRPKKQEALTAQVFVCSTPSGIPARDVHQQHRARAWQFVLNAFRHHGPRRFLYYIQKKRQAECSTPSGITACDGDRDLPDGEPRRADVLNAFRHHGSRRGAVRGVWRQLRVLNALRRHGP